MSQPFRSHYQRQFSQPSRSNYTNQSNYFSSRATNASAVPQYHSHPATQDDVPLDAFDKQLLSEIDSQQAPTPTQEHRRISLPPARSIGQPVQQVQQEFRDDLHNLGQPAGPGQSSPEALVSSPTVAALQNRQHVSSKRRPLEDPSQMGRPAKRQNNESQQHQASQQLNLSHAPPVIRGIHLVCTSYMPDRVRTVFPYEVLNAVQSKCYHTAFESDDNLVVSAPTGSGKTAIMELAICRVVMNTKNEDFKVVYQAPTKSLCNERYSDWEKKFKLLGLTCAELTGDTDYDHLRKVQQASIIITTPEKWDSVTRKWRDNARLVKMIKLFLVDEVHILKDQRGATLEAVVSRMKSIGSAVRFVALSATVPNSEDIATWLGKDPNQSQLPAHREVFDESFRPVRLEKNVYGFQYGINDFGLDNLLRKQVSSMIVNHGKKKPTMVFCMTRKSAVSTAQELADFWRKSASHQLPWRTLAAQQSVVVGDKELRETVPAGVAFHHGGLSADDRYAVEQGFLQGSISVICSTSTLAVGVNLPCYLVILQGTTTWTNTGVQPYSDLEIMQMLGRAGRPQFEQSACAVILTREQHVARYQKMVTGQELLESTLHLNLIEHLNAEIGLGTISDLASAQKWLSSTFLRVRVARNSDHYRLEGANDTTSTDELMQRLCEKDVKALLDANMIEDQGRIRCTELGEAMAKYYVNFETMKTFAAIPPRAKVSEILAVLTQAAEFAEMRLRGGEKSYYKELNKKIEIIYPINVDIAIPEHKASIILQAELGGASAPDGDNLRKHHQQHNTDRAVIFAHANRLIRCIIDCQIYLKDAVSVRNALELGRSIAAKAWECTPRQLKQLPEIGDVSCRKLASRGINSIEKLLSREAHQIEMAFQKAAPFGARYLAKLEAFPRLHVSLKEMGREHKHAQGMVLKIRAEIGFLNENPPSMFNKIPVYVCFLVEDSNGRLVDFRRFGGRKLGRIEEIFLSAHLDSPITFLRCHVMCDEIVGTAKSAELKVSVPDCAFPAAARERALLTARPASVLPRQGPSASTFDDGGIGDDDFVAATTNDNIEVVDDIDEVLLAAEKKSQQGNKQSKQDTTAAAAEEPTSEWIEPTQLTNGNWTCQHSCKQKGTECKHKCCHEGVAKPKKKPKTASKALSDPKQRKITGMDGVVSKSKPVLQSMDDKGNHDPTSIKAIMAPLRRFKSKEQVVQDPVDQGRVADTQDPSGTFDVDDDIYDDEENDFFDPMDCDWTTGTAKQPLHEEARRESRASEVSDFPKSAATGDEQPRPRPTHVALKDVQFQPDQPFFITGHSSSPQKQLLLNESLSATPSEDAAAIQNSPNSLLPSFASEFSPPAKSASIAEHDGEKLFRYVPMSEEYIKQMFSNESEQERAKRLHEEDQKRRWDGLPQRIYDEYHRFTELID